MKKSGNLCALVLIPTAVDGRPFHVSGGARTTQTSHSVASNYFIQTKIFKHENLIVKCLVAHYFGVSK